MLNLIRYIATASALVALAGCSTTQGPSSGQSSSQSATQSQAQIATKAANVLQREMNEPPKKRIPQDLVSQARCIAVFPSVVEAGFLLGARHGKGLVSCHQSSGGWSNASPAVYSVSGGSVGLQAGVSSSSIVVLFLTRDSTKQLLKGKIQFGSQIGVTAGPLGYNANISGAPAPVVTYVTSTSGLFAGVNLSGSKLNFNKLSNVNLYSANAKISSSNVNPRAILFNTNRVPSSVMPFTQALQSFVASHQQ